MIIFAKPSPSLYPLGAFSCITVVKVEEDGTTGSDSPNNTRFTYILTPPGFPQPLILLSVKYILLPRWWWG